MGPKTIQEVALPNTDPIEMVALRHVHAKSADTQLAQREGAGGSDHLELVEEDVVDVDL
jgi:hypothetical protein